MYYLYWNSSRLHRKIPHVDTLKTEFTQRWAFMSMTCFFFFFKAVNTGKLKDVPEKERGETQRGFSWTSVSARRSAVQRRVKRSFVTGANKSAPCSSRRGESDRAKTRRMEGTLNLVLPVFESIPSDLELFITAIKPRGPLNVRTLKALTVRTNQLFMRDRPLQSSLVFHCDDLSH